MSNNTNTLFWVITGAVIVLSIFLIVNESQNNTLGNIITKFNKIYTNKNEIFLDEDYSEYFDDEAFEGSNYKEIYACGSKTKIVDGYKVGIHDFIDTGGNVVIRWLIINTNEMVRDGRINISFFNCETNELLNEVYWYLKDIQPNIPLVLTSSGGMDNKDFQYYIDVKVVYN